MNQNYRNLIESIVEKTGYALRPVTQKEILHYEILALMQKENLLHTLTFAGGTALRLCYDNARQSEDLDFVTQPNYRPEQLKEFARKAEKRFTQELGIEIHVKEPKILQGNNIGRDNFDHINVDRWQIAFTLTPERPDLPKQKIKLEIASVPAYTREIMPIKSNYPSISTEPNILIPVESMTEIMADKLIALPASEKYIRHRDIWDLQWLAGKGIKPDIDLIQKKISDYHISDFDQKIINRMQSLSKIIESGDFANEMQRYLPEVIIDGVLRTPEQAQRIMTVVYNLLKEVCLSLYNEKRIS